MSDYHEAALSALSWFEACRDRNNVNAASIVRDSEPLEIVKGLTALVGALLTTSAAASGCTQAELIEQLRAMYLAGADA